METREYARERALRVLDAERELCVERLRLPQLLPQPRLLLRVLSARGLSPPGCCLLRVRLSLHLPERLFDPIALFFGRSDFGAEALRCSLRVRLRLGRLRRALFERLSRRRVRAPLLRVLPLELPRARFRILKILLGLRPLALRRLQRELQLLELRLDLRVCVLCPRELLLELRLLALHLMLSVLRRRPHVALLAARLGLFRGCLLRRACLRLRDPGTLLRRGAALLRGPELLLLCLHGSLVSQPRLTRLAPHRRCRLELVSQRAGFLIALCCFGASSLLAVLRLDERRPRLDQLPLGNAFRHPR
mmetsp:Transcript_31540/g.102768  ORF Transcript_31540/g.102768 Transcript_31540/m.102768 type:complete len:305 (+) Transcript_31540:1533-2447(+)